MCRRRTCDDETMAAHRPDSPIAVSPFFDDIIMPTAYRTYHVNVSLCLGLLIFVSSSAFAFILGCATRIQLKLEVLSQEKTKVEVPLQHGAYLSSNKSIPNLLLEGHREQVSLFQSEQAKTTKTGLSFFDDPSCYEVMVHPGMIVHSDPKVNHT